MFCVTVKKYGGQCFIAHLAPIFVYIHVSTKRMCLPYVLVIMMVMLIPVIMMTSTIFNIALGIIMII